MIQHRNNRFLAPSQLILLNNSFIAPRAILWRADPAPSFLKLKQLWRNLSKFKLGWRGYSRAHLKRR